MRYRAKYPPRRPYWSNAPIPPRFERNNKQYPVDPEVDSSCETEELPNGFTKIRSKNLDVLFRKDYYAQRTLSTATSSSAVSSEQGEPPEEDPAAGEQCSVNGGTGEPVVPEEEEEEVDGDEDVPDVGVHAEDENGDLEPPASSTPQEASETPIIQGDSDKKATTIIKSSKSVINTNATPFYPASYVPIPPTAAAQMPPVSTYGMPGPVSPGGGVASRPNLFLYSPSSNTMIPCEEIIIPNAVVPGQDVYQGPSNIYLAFPMENGTPGAPPGGSTPAGTTPPPAPQQPSTSVTSCGSSTNSTPPQAQSPQTSSSATGTRNWGPILLSK